MAEWLTPRTLDLEVRGSNLARRIVSLDKELYSTLSLFTQVYRCVPPPIQGGVAILPALLHTTETVNKLRPCRPLAVWLSARVRLYLLQALPFLYP